MPYYFLRHADYDDVPVEERPPVLWLRALGVNPSEVVAKPTILVDRVRNKVVYQAFEVDDNGHRQFCSCACDEPHHLKVFKEAELTRDPDDYGMLIADYAAMT